MYHLPDADGVRAITVYLTNPMAPHSVFIHAAGHSVEIARDTWEKMIHDLFHLQEDATALPQLSGADVYTGPATP